MNGGGRKGSLCRKEDSPSEREEKVLMAGRAANICQKSAPKPMNKRMWKLGNR